MFGKVIPGNGKHPLLKGSALLVLGKLLSLPALHRGVVLRKHLSFR